MIVLHVATCFATCAAFSAALQAQLASLPAVTQCRCCDVDNRFVYILILFILQDLDTSALTAHSQHPLQGAFVEYTELPEAVPEFLYTEHFAVPDDKVLHALVVSAKHILC
jgi:hypothetical protein